ncbi:MAG: RNA-dependent RNA polymerase [Fushun monolepta lauta xinmovirus 1]|uniref:RNA-directed RNA polymerase n=1 Tax=Fushun monolepta lauta xinmovirus 1 TaxID=2905554 RepID=A0A8K1XFJ6_9MONO|nr:MAG: RNA-dependent RNA polymerase [Fushun monolepta lauta xinmovirus 1]
MYITDPGSYHPPNLTNHFVNPLFIYCFIYGAIAISIFFLYLMIDGIRIVKEKDPVVLRLDGHLTGAVVPDEVDFLLDHEKFYCKRHIALKKKLDKQSITQSIYKACPSPWACLCKHLKDEASRMDKWSLSSMLYKVLFTSFKVNNHQRSVFFSNENFNAPDVDTGRISHAYSVNPLLLESLSWKMVSEIYKDKIIKSALVPGDMQKLSPYIHIEKEIFFFKCPSHGQSVGPTNLFLGVLDILQTRFTIYLNWSLRETLNNEKGLLNKGHKIVYHTEKLWPHLKESFFKIMKLWDSYVIGMICSDTVKDTGFDRLALSSEQEISSIYKHFRRDLAPLWFPGTDDDSLRFALEMSTLARSFGHPLLDPIGSVNKLREKVFKSINCDKFVIRDVRCTFVKLLIKGYISNHHHWPAIEWVSPPHPLIMKAYQDNRFLSPSETKMVDLSEWDSIKFKQNFDFDYSLDTSELLSDKSCSPPLSYWTQKYDPCGFRIHHQQYKPRLPPQETRVMLRYLKGYPGEVKEVIDEVESGQLDIENNIVFLTRKERELSEGGRVYCSQTYRQRLLQTACESNIKRFIYKYFPQQSMSDTELSLQKKIAAMVKVQSRGGEIYNFDLEKWNQLQRAESVDVIAKDIDNLFGFNNLYTDAHSWIQRCYIFINSRVNPPKISLGTQVAPTYRLGKEGLEMTRYKDNKSSLLLGSKLPVIGPSCHIGQIGGLEGMKQKLWHNGTSCTFNLAAENNRLNISVLGCADNQTVAVQYTPGQGSPTRIRETRLSFLNELDRLFSGQGLKLKREETWVSKRLFEYGKRRWLYGIPVESSTKRAARIILEEGDGIPTLEVSLGMLATGTENMASSTINPQPAFIIYLSHLGLFFIRRRILILEDPLFDIIYAALCYWPNVLGGLPISSLPNHIIRGFDDHLTLWISMYKTFSRKFPDSWGVLKILTPMTKKRPIMYEHLIEDIFSLNISTLMTTSLAIRDQVKHLIPLFTTNTEIRKILDLDIRDNPQIIAEISRMRPFYAPLAHELYRNSNAGTIKHLQSKLTNVQSIVKLAREYSDVNLYSELERTDMVLIDMVRKKISKASAQLGSGKDTGNLQRLILGDCSYKSAREARIDSWGFEPMGATHPVPWEQFKIVPFESLHPGSYDRSMSIMLSNEVRPSVRLPTKVGPYPTYFGSHTHVKSVSSRVQFLNTTPFVDSIRNLINLLAWARKIKSQELEDFILRLIESKNALLPHDITMQDLINTCPNIYSGHLFHRFHTITESRGALTNSLPILSSHMSFTTSTMTEITKDGKDYNIFFQLCFLYAISYITNLYFSPKAPFIFPEYRLILACSCTHELIEPQVSITPLRHDRSDQRLTALGNQEHFQFTEEGSSLSDLRLSLSLSASKDTAEDISSFMTSSLAERTIRGEISSVDHFLLTNIVEMRDIHLLSYLIGCVIHSRFLRLSLISNSPISKGLSPYYVCQPLVLILIRCKRLGECLQLLETGFSISSPKYDIKLLSKSIWEGIKHLMESQKGSILSNVMGLRLRESDDVIIDKHVSTFLNILMSVYKNELQRRKDTCKQDISKLYSEIEYLVKDSYIYFLIDSRCSKVSPFVDLIFNLNVDFIFAKMHKYQVFQKRGKEQDKSCSRNYVKYENNFNIFKCKTCNEVSVDITMKFQKDTVNLGNHLNKELIDISLCIYHQDEEAFSSIIIDTRNETIRTTYNEAKPHIINLLGSFMINKYKRYYPRINGERKRSLYSDIKTRSWDIYTINKELNVVRHAERVNSRDHTLSAYLATNILYKGSNFHQKYSLPQSLTSRSIPTYQTSKLVWRAGHVGKLRDIPIPQFDKYKDPPLSRESTWPKIGYARSRVNIPDSPSYCFCTSHIDLCPQNDEKAYILPYQLLHFTSHICKPLGSLNSSPNSMLLRVSSLSPNIIKPHILNLAGGSGSDLVLLAHYYPQATLSFNSLISKNDFFPLDMGYPVPVAVLNDPCIDIPALIENSRPLLHGFNDICCPEFLAKLIHYIDGIFLRREKTDRDSIIITADLETLELKSYNYLLKLVDTTLDHCLSLDIECHFLYTIRVSKININPFITLTNKFNTRIELYRSDPHNTSLVRVTSSSHPMQNHLRGSINTTSKILASIRDDFQRYSCPCIYGTKHICFSCIDLGNPCLSDETRDYPTSTLVNSSLEMMTRLRNKYYDRGLSSCVIRWNLTSQENCPLSCGWLLARFEHIFGINKISLLKNNPVYSSMYEAEKGLFLTQHAVEEIFILYLIAHTLHLLELHDGIDIIYQILCKSRIIYQYERIDESEELNVVFIHKVEKAPTTPYTYLIKKHKDLIRDVIIGILEGGNSCAICPLPDHYPLGPGSDNAGVDTIKTKLTWDQIKKRIKLHKQITEEVVQLIKETTT